MLVALTVLIVVVVMMLVALTVLIVVVVMMLVAFAMLVVAVVMMVMLLKLCLKLLEGGIESISVFHRLKYLFAGKLVHRSGYNNGILIMLAKERNSLGNLFLARLIGMRKNYGRSVGYLIIIKFTEITDIHLALACVGNGGEAIKDRIGALKLLNRLDYIGKLAYARGLDYDSIGGVLVKHLAECLGEISDERATDTTRIHLGYLDSRILKEASVNTDLSEFVLYKNDLFACISLFNELFYKSSLSRTEKARKYINLGHFLVLSNFFQLTFYYNLSGMSIKQILIFCII